MTKRLVSLHEADELHPKYENRKSIKDYDVFEHRYLEDCSLKKIRLVKMAENNARDTRFKQLKIMVSYCCIR